MEKEVSFKVNHHVVTIDFNSTAYFSLSADIYQLAVIEKEVLAEIVREDIEGNLEFYIDDLQDMSINELLEHKVNMILDGYDDYYDDNNIYSEAKDDDLIQVEFVALGQCYDDLLDLLPSSEPLKELVSLWKKYHLKENVDQTVINRVVDLLNQLDGGKSDYDLAEEIVSDYIEENY